MKKWRRIIRFDWPLHFILVLTNWLPDNLALLKLRGWLASPFFKSAGRNLQIGRDVTFYNPSQITLGNNVYIAKGCWFSAGGGITISNNILIGPYVIISTSNHSLENGAYYFGEPVDVSPVIINSGSWLGAHVTILAGSKIEESCLIAANSVFKGGSIKFGIYAGLPAKLVKLAKTNDS